MNAATSVMYQMLLANPPPPLDVKHDTNLFVNAPQCDFISTHRNYFYGDCAVSWSFGATIYVGLVSLILLVCELRASYHCTMCTRHPDLVSYAIPIFHITFTCLLSFLIIIPNNLLMILVQVPSNATSSKKVLRCK